MIIQPAVKRLLTHAILEVRLAAMDCQRGFDNQLQAAWGSVTVEAVDAPTLKRQAAEGFRPEEAPPPKTPATEGVPRRQEGLTRAAAVSSLAAKLKALRKTLAAGKPVRDDVARTGPHTPSGRAITLACCQLQNRLSLASLLIDDRPTQYSPIPC